MSLRPRPTSIDPEVLNVVTGLLLGQVPDRNHAIHCGEEVICYANGQVFPDPIPAVEMMAPTPGTRAMSANAAANLCKVLASSWGEQHKLGAISQSQWISFALAVIQAVQGLLQG